MIARVFGCAACEGRALARWELEAGVSGVVTRGGWALALLMGHEHKIVGLSPIFGFDPKLAGLRGLMPDSSRRLRRAGEGYDGCAPFEHPKVAC